MLNTLLTIGLLILLINLGQLYQKKKKEFHNAQKLNFEILKTNEEIKQTLAIGLYHRFNKTQGELEGEGYNPHQFESFVAEVMQKYYGGNTYVTPPIGDFGVDIEHNRSDGRYLGQVKCFSNSIPFDPIALIHSNMIKQNVKGGFVVTTSQFTEPAIQYNEGLKIELIDGIKLVEYWLAGSEKSIENLKTERKTESA